MDKILIERNGTNGFSSYRVPGAVTLSNGRVLLCYEGCAEDGSRTLLMRSSTDEGRSFGPRTELDRTREKELLHNPMFLADYPVVYLPGTRH